MPKKSKIQAKAASRRKKARRRVKKFTIELQEALREQRREHRVVTETHYERDGSI